jgi:hypothetical protein
MTKIPQTQSIKIESLRAIMPFYVILKLKRQKHHSLQVKGFFILRVKILL